MAANLAQQSGRTLSQARVTTNRQTVLPGRRETDLDALGVRSDLRTAARGDGGAGDLQRSLSGFLQSAQGAYEAQTEARKPMYAEEAAAGAEAQTLGNVDPVASARSLSYRTAVNTTRARQTIVTAGAAIDEAVTALIARSEANDDPLDPSDDFGIEDVEDGLNQIISNVLFDGEGNALEWGDSVSHMAVVQGLARLKNEAFVKAETAIRTQVRENHVRTLGVGVALDVTQFDGTTPIDFEGYVAQAGAGGVGAAEAVPRLMEAAIGSAQEHDNANALDALAQSVRGDGQPSFNANQKLQLLNNANAIRDRVERETEERRDDLSAETLSGYLLTGSPVPMSQLNADYAAGKLTPADLRIAQANNEHIADRAYMMGQRAEAAADRAYNRSQRGRGGSRGGGDGQDAEDVLMGALYAETATPAQVLRASAEGLSNGSIDAAEHRRVVRDVAAFRNTPALETESQAGRQRRSLDRVINHPTIPARVRNQALGRFHRGLRQGEDPQVALGNSLLSIGVRRDRAGEIAAR